MAVIFDREQHKCDYFFYVHLAFLNQVHNLFIFCGHIATAIKVTKFCYHYDEVVVLKIRTTFFFRPNSTRWLRKGPKH